MHFHAKKLVGTIDGLKPSILYCAMYVVNQPAALLSHYFAAGYTGTRTWAQRQRTLGTRYTLSRLRRDFACSTSPTHHRRVTWRRARSGSTPDKPTCPSPSAWPCSVRQRAINSARGRDCSERTHSACHPCSRAVKALLNSAVTGGRRRVGGIHL